MRPAGFLLRLTSLGAGAFLEKTPQRVVDAGFKDHSVGVCKPLGGGRFIATAL